MPFSRTLYHTSHGYGPAWFPFCWGLAISKTFAGKKSAGIGFLGNTWPLRLPFPEAPRDKIKLTARAPVATPSNPVNRRRSERVMLRMRVTVTAEDIERRPQQMEGMTQVVNAHGGLMKMQMELHMGQSMILTNPQNNVEQGCRVVGVDDTAEGDFAVAFEFERPNPKFWPVVFPPGDWHALAPDSSQRVSP